MINNPKLYEINVASWLYDLSRKYGNDLKLRHVPTEEWDRLRDSGFHYIWLMGIWKRSKAGMKIFQGEDEYREFQAHLDSIVPGWSDDDVPGSPYSIAAYEPDPLFGGWDDIEAVREELHTREMKLILDFVPNHTAPDHPWIFHHPDYYIQGSATDYKKNPASFSPIIQGDKTVYIARGKDPFFPPWTDTAQLNYFNPHMRSAMIVELKKIAEHCDGVRCDMAMLVLNEIFAGTWKWAGPATGPVGDKEFWEEVREEIPGLLLIAEAYWNTHRHLQQLGFDYVYDKEFYDLLRRLSPAEITGHLKADYSCQKKLVRFIENHDEGRSAHVFDRDRLQAVITLFSTVPGMKLYHQGQSEGKQIRIPVQVRRVRTEEPDEYIRALYRKIYHITGQDAFINGEWNLKDVLPIFDDSYVNLLAFTWELRNTLKLVVVNLSGKDAQGRIPFEQETNDHAEYVFLDEFNDRTYTRGGNDLIDNGLHVILGGFHAHIFDISPTMQRQR